MRWLVGTPAAAATLRGAAACLGAPAAAQRRLLRSSAGDRREGGFLGGISTSLSDALQIGKRSPRFSKPGSPTNAKDPFHPLGELKLTYDDMLRRVRDRLELSNRLEAEALENKGKVHRHELLLKAQGYTLGVKESTVPGAGRGLFLTRGGFKAGEIITFYPGTVYTVNSLLEIAARESLSEFGAPQEPLLPLFLIKNSYLLSERQVLYPDRWHTVDLMCDGNPFHQSALRFLQERRDQRADRSWLELTHDPHQEKEEYFEEILLDRRGVGQALKKGFTHTDLGNRSMLALGHLINHADNAHVRMIFVPMPEDFPKDLLALAPTVNGHQSVKTGRWVIAAVAVRDFDQAEGELFLNYARNPKSIGWQETPKR